MLPIICQTVSNENKSEERIQAYLKACSKNKNECIPFFLRVNIKSQLPG